MRHASTLTVLFGALAIGLCAPMRAEDEAANANLAAIAARPLTVRQLAAETRNWVHMRSLVGAADQRRLADARLRVELQGAFFSNPLNDPNYNHTRQEVRDVYVKLYREMIQRQFPIDELFTDGIRSQFQGQSKAGEVGRDRGLQLSPRLALGTSGYIGTTVSLPHSHSPILQNLTLSMEKGYMDGQLGIDLRYQEGERRFVQLERVSGDRTTGERYSATLVLRF